MQRGQNGIQCTCGSETVENGKVFTTSAEVLLDSFLLCGRNLFSIFEIKELAAASLKSAQ